MLSPPPTMPLPPTPAAPVKEQLPLEDADGRSAAHDLRMNGRGEEADADSSDDDDGVSSGPEASRSIGTLSPSPPLTPRGGPHLGNSTSPALSGASTLRKVDKLYVDLADWAPPASISTASATPHHVPHLPPPTKSPRASSTETKSISTVTPTSFPNTQLSPLQQSLSHSLSKLLTEEVFLKYLQSSIGYTRFHSYLTDYPSKSSVASAAALELWRDLNVLKELERRAALASRGIRDTYLVDGQKKVDVPLPMMRELVGGLRGVIGNSTGLEKPSRALLDSLYASEFEGFVKYRLLKHTSVKLGQYDLETKDRKGLGEAFVLSNPRLPDQPIVLASPAFCKLTGYSPDMILGRNCRFLQGEATAPSSVKSVKEAIAAGQEVTQLLLNYKLDGTPFWNLLCCIPLHDSKGELTYFIGGQTNITGAVSSGDGADLSFILGGQGDVSAPASMDPSTFSPEISEYRSPYNDDEVDSPQTSAPPSPPPATIPNGSPTESPSESFSKRLFGAFKIKTKPSARSPVAETQLIAPAEQLLTAAPAAIENRIAEFTSTYEKLLLFRPEQQEIIFVTSAFLRHCGLPGTSQRDVYTSPLLYMDFSRLLGGEPGEKREARAKFKKAVKARESLSMPCVIRFKEKGAYGKFQSAAPSTPGVLHLTPLKDLADEVVAYVAVFG